MARRKLKDLVDELVMWREELYGPMDDISAYPPYASNTPGVCSVWVLNINTTFAVTDPIPRTENRVREVTNNIKSGDYTRPEIYFPSEFALSAFLSIAEPLLRKIAMRLLKKAINEFKKER